MCYPPWPAAGTQDGHSQTPPLIPGRPLSCDSVFSAQTLEHGAPDTSGSCGRGPAEAAERSL